MLTICSDIAGALAVTRQQRIVHGDLKASNILITEAGRVKLTDFGISRFAGDASVGAGSFSAVSPEQYRGEPVDIRSDLFVLGCLMYRMLTGQEPFCRGGKLDPGLLLESQPALLPELLAPESIAPGELVTLMEALLQKDPGQRPANTHEVRRVLRDVSRTVPLAACNSLQEEAGPCFRQESAEDIPPRIPAELAREGRSRMETAAGSGILYRLRGRQGRTALLACLPLLLVAVLSLYLFKGATSIHIERPLLQIEANTELPEELSSDWLVNETLAALRMQLGDIAPKGPGAGVQESTFYSPSAEQARPRPPQETLQIGLRCHSGLCVYGVTRECGDETGYQQAVMFPDMSLSQWRQLIRSAIEALYP